MKLLVFFAFSFVSVGVLAQVPDKSNPRALPDTSGIFKTNSGEAFQKQLQKAFPKEQFEKGLPANKKGHVVLLPQDQMPCFVPDTNAMAPVPNAWSAIAVPYRPQYHPIPNPALPSSPLLKYNALDNDNSLGAPSK